MSDFGSGHNLTVHGFEPCIGLCADSSEPAACFRFCDSLSLCPSPALFLSLSKINNKKIYILKKQQLKTEPPYDPAIALMGGYPKKMKPQGAWVAQLVGRLTRFWLRSCSQGHVIEPHIVLCTESGACLGFSLPLSFSLSLCLCPTPSLAHPL